MPTFPTLAYIANEIAPDGTIQAALLFKPFSEMCLAVFVMYLPFISEMPRNGIVPI